MKYRIQIKQTWLGTLNRVITDKAANIVMMEKRDTISNVMVTDNTSGKELVSDRSNVRKSYSEIVKNMVGEQKDHEIGLNYSDFHAEIYSTSTPEKRLQTNHDGVRRRRTRGSYHHFYLSERDTEVIVGGRDYVSTFFTFFIQDGSIGVILKRIIISKDDCSK